MGVTASSAVLQTSAVLPVHVFELFVAVTFSALLNWIAEFHRTFTSLDAQVTLTPHTASNIFITLFWTYFSTLEPANAVCSSWMYSQIQQGLWHFIFLVSIFHFESS